MFAAKDVAVTRRRTASDPAKANERFVRRTTCRVSGCRSRSEAVPDWCCVGRWDEECDKQRTEERDEACDGKRGGLSVAVKEAGRLSSFFGNSLRTASSLRRRASEASVSHQIFWA